MAPLSVRTAHPTRKREYGPEKEQGFWENSLAIRLLGMNDVFLPGGSCFYALGGGKTREKARGERKRVYRYEEHIRAVSCTKGGKERER